MITLRWSGGGGRPAHGPALGIAGSWRRFSALQLLGGNPPLAPASRSSSPRKGDGGFAAWGAGGRIAPTGLCARSPAALHTALPQGQGFRRVVGLHWASPGSIGLLVRSRPCTPRPPRDARQLWVTFAQAKESCQVCLAHGGESGRLSASGSSPVTRFAARVSVLHYASRRLVQVLFPVGISRALLSALRTVERASSERAAVVLGPTVRAALLSSPERRQWSAFFPDCLCHSTFPSKSFALWRVGETPARGVVLKPKPSVEMALDWIGVAFFFLPKRGN